MIEERRVRLFRIGRAQIVLIPRAFELPGETALIRKENGKPILEPAPANPCESRD